MLVARNVYSTCSRMLYNYSLIILNYSVINIIVIFVTVTEVPSSLLLQSIIRPLPSGSEQPPLSVAPPAVPPATTTIRLNPLYGVSPLGPVQFNKEQIHRLNMLDAAFRHLPHPSDSERPR